MALMDWRHNLLGVLDAYRSAGKLSESRVGSIVGGTGIFFRRIRAGGECSATNYHRAMQWFSDHWPDDLDWPAGVSRPATASTTEVA